jgi:HK97 family phage prohead protease
MNREDWEVRTYAEALTIGELDAPPAQAGRYSEITGRAVPFDVWAPVEGWLVESHAPGSLERSTKAGSAKGLPLLLWHDNRRWPVGRSLAWRNESDGLWGRWELNETADAQQAGSLARSGELGYLSIGFLPLQDDWHEGAQDRDGRFQVTRLESRLLEVSLTPTPAFVDAQVSEVRDQFVHTRSRPPAPPPATPDEVAKWRTFLDEARSVEVH